jgi:metallo-beta-lactamase family protein
VRTVTGSSHLVETPTANVLLDAGLFQGKRDKFYEINTTFSYSPRTIDALILSHAHIDHCGNIPSLLKKGMRCKIYCTHATRDLCKLMLEDAGKIQEEDIKYVNKINKRLGLPPRQPLYTKNEAIRAARRRFQTVSYGQRVGVAKNVTATLGDAGHILGSSTVIVEAIDGGTTVRLGYAVDLGRKNLPMLNDPSIPRDSITWLSRARTAAGSTLRSKRPRVSCLRRLNGPSSARGKSLFRRLRSNGPRRCSIF